MPFDEQDYRAAQDQAQAWAVSNELLASEGFAGVSASMAFDEQGCQKLQRFFEDLPLPKRQKLALALALGLRGQVVRACRSKYANYVVQKLAEVLTTSEEVDFVVEEINGSGSGLDVVQHPFGCRVVQRLIEMQLGKAKEVAALIGAVLGSLEECCRHKYGHYVVQSIYEHGQPEQRQRVVAACLEHLFELAQDAQAGYVVAFILRFREDQDRQSLIQEGLLAGGPDGLVALTRGKGAHCGTLMVEELLVRARQRTEEMLRQRVQELKASKHGRRLIINYNLEDGQVEDGQVEQGS